MIKNYLLTAMKNFKANKIFSFINISGLAIRISAALVIYLSGASLVQFVTLLSKDIVSLGLIAFVIALPLAGRAMNTWLRDFAYRIHISWRIFAVYALNLRTIKAAISNPVKSLRTE